jgi:hypothetical protein
MEGSLVAYKTFTNGSVLPASDVQTYLMDQSVMVFSSSTTRAAALTAPVEGMLTWLEDVNRYENYNGTAWVRLGSGILQIVSVTKSDTFTVSSTSLTNITGLAATITPSSASSKVLVLMTIGGVDASADLLISGDVTRGGTAIGIGDTAGSRIRASWQTGYQQVNRMQVPSFNFLDSPATTSATTYQARIRSNTGTVYVNRSGTDTDSTLYSRSISTMTLMEVSA